MRLKLVLFLGVVSEPNKRLHFFQTIDDHLRRLDKLLRQDSGISDTSSNKNGSAILVKSDNVVVINSETVSNSDTVISSSDSATGSDSASTSDSGSSGKHYIGPQSLSGNDSEEDFFPKRPQGLQRNAGECCSVLQA